MNMAEIKKWNHSREGLLTGELVAEEGGWSDIKLAAPWKGPWKECEVGEILTVRTSMLTLIEDQP